MGDYLNMETVKIKILFNGLITEEKLLLYESSVEDAVKIVLLFNGAKYVAESENYFAALISIRKQVESNGILLMCNGTAKNIYPSPMSLSMGTGRKAYITRMGQQAFNKDLVDIFDYVEGFEHCSIQEQEEYHRSWLESLKCI